MTLTCAIDCRRGSNGSSGAIVGAARRMAVCFRGPHIGGGDSSLVGATSPTSRPKKRIPFGAVGERSQTRREGHAHNLSLMPCPLCPESRQVIASQRNDEKGQFPTHAPRQNARGLPSKIAKSLAEIAPLRHHPRAQKCHSLTRSFISIEWYWQPRSARLVTPAPALVQPSYPVDQRSPSHV